MPGAKLAGSALNMAMHYWLYRASPAVGAPNRWDGDNFERLGAAEPIKRAISRIVPKCQWGIVEGRWVNTFNQAPQIDLETLDEDPEQVAYIRVLYADLDVIRAIANALDLRAFNTETCEFVLP